MSAQHNAVETPLAPLPDSATHSRNSIRPLRELVATPARKLLGRRPAPPAAGACGPSAWTACGRRASALSASPRAVQNWVSALSHALRARAPAPQQLDALEGYARWAATYEQDMDGHPLALAETGAMCSLLPPCEGIVALDAACGTGRYARLLAQQGAQQVIGIDQSLPMLELAQAASNADARLQFIQGSLLHLPLSDESCDLAVVALALSHLRTAQLCQAFGELSRVLKPGGILLMSEMHPFGALTGGRCRFERSEGKRQQVYHIQTHTHLHEDYFTAAQAANLTLEAMREPRLTDDLFPAFERAGMADFARRFAGFPLALVCRWRKSS